MIKSILVAAGLSLAIVSSAVAVTPPSKPGAASSDVVQVKKRWNNNWKWNKNRHGRHGYNERHYGHPPRGWNRYGYRPWGWQRRGCISIGPVWYCP